MKNVLVTGSTGFVGQNLLPYLQKNEYKVRGVSRKSPNNELLYSELDQKILDEAFALIHLAGKAHDLKKTSEDSEYFTVNRDLTIQLFDQFLKSKCSIFIYMSSVKAAADSVEGFLREDVIPNPITPYGKSKQEAERYILSKELPEGKRVYILRPCMIHGPGNKGNLNLLYAFASKGIPYPLASYENQRSFLSVDNLSFVIKELLKKPVKSGIYNVSDNTALSTNEVVDLIAHSLHKKSPLLRVPKFIMNSIAKLGDVLKLPINSERLGKLTEDYRVDNSKLLNNLGSKLPLTTEEGLLLTFKSFENDVV